MKNVLCLLQSHGALEQKPPWPPKPGEEVTSSRQQPQNLGIRRAHEPLFGRSGNLDEAGGEQEDEPTSLRGFWRAIQSALGSLLS